MQTRIKADRDCASVSAASVIAKVHRDRHMIEADDVHPGYLWKSNKGYASTEHYAAIHEIGPSQRCTGRPGCTSRRPRSSSSRTFE